MDYLQTGRAIEVFTPLGENVVVPVSLDGREAISQLFHFELEVLAENQTVIPFEQVLGGPVATRLRLPSGSFRYLCGYCSRFSQGMRDEVFTRYRMEIVPGFWFLTRRAQSKIFQQKSVPEILKIVLKDLEVSYELTGTYYPRDYCVQYRETDFHFASRLMEEEGIFYFFRHSEQGHTLVISDGPQSQVDLKEPAIYEELEGGNKPEDRIHHWEKTQELRPGRVRLWDHTFELAHDHLEASAAASGSVQAGQVAHPLQVGRSDRLEIFDYPGEYAQRFDGVDPVGGDRQSDLQRIFEDNQRTARIRLQEQLAPAVVIAGGSTRRDFASGSRFRLTRHFNGDGGYLLTEVRHFARIEGTYRSDDGGGEFTYGNTFTCIPADTPFRPARSTPKPVVQGTQTAVVVGPPGEKIFPDKYGRVKVQFHWDRQGQHNERSSCWVRVAQFAAGGGWGAIHIPRVGQEVVVAFEEGDPDRPLITGAVYNPGQMPPFKLPDKKMISGYRSNSYPGPDGGGNNEISVDDTKGKERMYLHAQYNQDTVVGHNRTASVKVNDSESVGNNQSVSIGGNRTETVKGAENYTVSKDRLETVVGDRHLVVKSQMLEKVTSDRHVHVGGDHNEKVDGGVSLTVGTSYQEKTGVKHAVDSGQEIHLKAGMKVILEAGVQLTIKGPGGFVDINPSGVTIQGTMVLINSGGAAGSGSGSSPKAPTDATEAK